LVGRNFLDSEVRNEVHDVLQRTLHSHSNKLSSGQWICNSEVDEFDTMELLDDWYEDSAMTNSEVSSTAQQIRTNIQSASTRKEEEVYRAGNIKIEEMILPTEIFLDDSSTFSNGDESNHPRDNLVSAVESAVNPIPLNVTPAKKNALPFSPGGMSSATKRNKINYDLLDPTLPAWEIPKSPMDHLFRSGYGGMGQSSLQEVIELVEDDSDEDEFGFSFSPKMNKSSPKDSRTEKLQKAKSKYNLPKSLPLAKENGHVKHGRKEPKKKAANVIPGSSTVAKKSIVKRADDNYVKQKTTRVTAKSVQNPVAKSVVEHSSLHSQQNGFAESYLAQSEPTDVQFTKSSSLNQMISNSYLEFLSHYAKLNNNLKPGKEKAKPEDISYKGQISSLRSDFNLLRAKPKTKKTVSKVQHAQRLKST
jgi:hypothetical protein